MDGTGRKTGKKTGLRKRKEAEVKLTFFKAATTLFREKGFEATSVDEIAERAGYSRATFFNHFGSKKGVLRYYGQLLEENVERRVSELQASTSPVDRLREVLFAMASEADRHIDELKQVYFQSLRDPEYLSAPTSARRRIFEMVRTLVEEAQGEGLIRRDLPAVEIAFHVLSIYNGAVLAAVTGMAEAESTMRSGWILVIEGARGGNSADR